jgi:hypothetical protein
METEIEQETLSHTTAAIRHYKTKMLCFVEGNLKRVVESDGKQVRLSCGHVRPLTTESRLLAIAT